MLKFNLYLFLALVLFSITLLACAETHHKANNVIGYNALTLDETIIKHCGSKWQEKYAAFHKEMMSKTSDDKRLLVYVCHHHEYPCGGLGDQLMGIMNSFLISLITDRAFMISYPEFTAAFQPVSIDWRYKNEVTLLDYDTYSFESMSLREEGKNGAHDALLVTMMNQDPDIGFRFENFNKASEKYKIIFLRTNRARSLKFINSQTWWGAKLRSLGVDGNRISGCILRFLLRPIAMITKRARHKERLLTSKNKFSVCIHVRMIRYQQADDSFFNSVDISTQLMSNIDFSFKCAKNISDYFAKPGQEVKWFLISSSNILKLKAAELYPDVLLKTRIVPQHVDLVNSAALSTALRSTVVDWYLFSTCSKHVFFSSGLSKSAVAYSLKENSAYMFPHSIFTGEYTRAPSNWEQYCIPASPTSLEEMGIEWSGL